MSDEDRELDRQWRSRYGEPLPMLGGADIVRAILARNIPAAATPEPSFVESENPSKVG